MTAAQKSLPPSRRTPRSVAAFTLLEVMIATGIFFIAIFAILALVFTNLRNARLLQKSGVNTGPVAADLYYSTNQWQDGDADSGDFGEMYPGYKWDYSVAEISTNGFYKVDFILTSPEGVVETNLSAFYWRPGSGSGAGGNLPIFGR